MNLSTRFLGRPAALAAVGLSLALGGCATSSRVGVTQDFDHAVNFRAYKTWSWYPQQGTDTEGGPATNKGYESFLDQRIRAAVQREMTAKGMTYVEKGSDVFVAYSARVEDKQQVSPYSYGYPYGYGYGWYGRGPMPAVYNYKAGTLVIDIVDAKRKELAWRGTGQAQLDQNTINESETNRIVTSILGNYPPGAENRGSAAQR